MFSLLEASSLKKLQRKTISHGIKVEKPDDRFRQQGFKQRKVNADSFVGVKSRSRRGCNACRRRKKRCDHVHPVCGSCQLRNESCQWSNEPKIVDSIILNEQAVESTITPSDTVSPIDNHITKDALPLAGPRDSTAIQQIDVQNMNAFTTGTPGLSEVIPDLQSPFPVFESTPIEPLNYERISIPGLNSAVQSTTNRLPDISSILNLPSSMDNNPAMLTRWDDSPVLGSLEYPSDNERNDSDTVVTTKSVTESALDDVFRIRSTIPVHPYFTHQHSFLDSRGELFLNFYRYKVTRVVAVCGESSNYFVRSHLKFCRYDEAICNLIAAWGGLYLRGSLNDPDVQVYYQKAIHLFNNSYISKSGKSRVYRFWVLVFYAVLYGLYVCAGDCSAWKIVFLRFRDFVEYCGGLKKVCEEYHYSNDVVFMMSLFQYTDITSSEVLLNGTTYPMDVYRDLFSKVDFSTYGVDPVQGVFQPIYFRLGDVANAKALVRERKKDLQQKYDEAADANFNNIALNEIYLKASEEYSAFTESLFEELMREVKNERPCQAQLDLLIDDERESKLQVDTFKAYQCVCQVYCYLFIKGVPPCTTEVQLLVHEILMVIQSLMESKMLVSMVIPLLTCGMAVHSQQDRARIEQGFNRLLKSCAVHNVDTAWEITQEVWQRNNNGTITVDWSEICHEKGWDFSAC